MTSQPCPDCEFANETGAATCARCGRSLARDSGGESAAPQTQADVARRVRERTLVERKRRIWRNAMFFVIVTIAMLYVALAERDRQAVRNATDIGRRLATALQQDFDQQGRLPNRVPDLGQQYRLALTQFMTNPIYTSQYPTLDPVAVMFTKQPVSLYFRPPGRVVVLLERKTFRSEWLDEAAFHERRSALGLGVGAD
jgi:uncharacterized Zn finger protein (UPF0148 family)